MPEGRSVCMEMVGFYAKHLAAEAFNLALKLKATGGVFFAGGVTPKIRNLALQTVFLEHFFSVGRLRPLVEAILFTKDRIEMIL